MDIRIAYKIMRARPPDMLPSAPSPEPSSTEDPRRRSSGLQRSLSSAMMTVALDPDTEFTGAEGYPEPACSPAPADAAEGEPSLHMMSRTLLPSARGVTIGPFAEAITAATSPPGSRSMRRRFEGGLAASRSGGLSPTLQLQPQPPETSTSPFATSLQIRAASPQYRATSPQHRSATSSSYNSGATGAGGGGGGSFRSHASKRASQQSLLPRVPSQKLRQPSGGPSLPADDLPPGGGGGGLRAGLSRPVGLTLRSSASAVSLSGPSVETGGRYTDVGMVSDLDSSWLDSPPSASSPASAGVGAGGGGGGGGSGPPTTTRFRSSCGSMGGGAAWLLSPRGGGGVMLQRAESGCGGLSGGEGLRDAGPSGPHGDPSLAHTGDERPAHHDADVGAVSGGMRASATSEGSSRGWKTSGEGALESPRLLPALPGSNMSQSGEAVGPGTSCTSGGASAVAAAIADGGSSGGGGGSTARVQWRQPAVQPDIHQQAQNLRRSFKGAMPGPGGRQGVLLNDGGGGGAAANPANATSDVDGDDVVAEAAELDSLEQWAASGGAPQALPAALSATVEQRRALRRLAYLRTRVLRTRASSPCSCPEPGGPFVGSAPSWLDGGTLMGRQGSESLAALASQLSRLPHIDVDQMRDPQYRSQLKLRGRQNKAPPKEQPGEFDDMPIPIPGRRRPWKPVHK